jgi:protein gp37
MGETTGIDWTDHTFNPWIGCSRVSPGCVNCYADDMSQRFGMGKGQSLWRRHGKRQVTSAGNWRNPQKWDTAAFLAGRQARVFCASMADVFEDRRDLDEPRARLWRLIEGMPHLDWQLLTKRIDRVAELVPWGNSWPPNVWLGTSIENQTWADRRLPVLRTIPAAVRFVSAEPLLGPVRLDLDGIGWVICGGESGHNARPMDPAWARQIRDDCLAAGVPFFFKQWGGITSKANGKVLDGREWCEFPELLVA